MRWRALVFVAGVLLLASSTEGQDEKDEKDDKEPKDIEDAVKQKIEKACGDSAEGLLELYQELLNGDLLPEDLLAKLRDVQLSAVCIEQLSKLMREGLELKPDEERSDDFYAQVMNLICQHKGNKKFLEGSLEYFEEDAEKCGVLHALVLYYVDRCIDPRNVHFIAELMKKFKCYELSGYFAVDIGMLKARHYLLLGPEYMDDFIRRRIDTPKNVLWLLFELSKSKLLDFAPCKVVQVIMDAANFRLKNANFLEIITEALDDMDAYTEDLLKLLGFTDVEIEEIIAGMDRLENLKPMVGILPYLQGDLCRTWSQLILQLGSVLGESVEMEDVVEEVAATSYECAGMPTPRDMEAHHVMKVRSCLPVWERVFTAMLKEAGRQIMEYLQPFVDDAKAELDAEGGEATEEMVHMAVYETLMLITDEVAEKRDEIVNLDELWAHIKEEVDSECLMVLHALLEMVPNVPINEVVLRFATWRLGPNWKNFDDVMHTIDPITFIYGVADGEELEDIMDKKRRRKRQAGEDDDDGKGKDDDDDKDHDKGEEDFAFDPHCGQDLDCWHSYMKVEHIMRAAYGLDMLEGACGGQCGVKRPPCGFKCGQKIAEQLEDNDVDLNDLGNLLPCLDPKKVIDGIEEGKCEDITMVDFEPHQLADMEKKCRGDKDLSDIDPADMGCLLPFSNYGQLKELFKNSHEETCDALLSVAPECGHKFPESVKTAIGQMCDVDDILETDPGAVDPERLDDDQLVEHKVDILDSLDYDLKNLDRPGSKSKAHKILKKLKELQEDVKNDDIKGRQGLQKVIPLKTIKEGGDLPKAEDEDDYEDKVHKARAKKKKVPTATLR